MASGKQAKVVITANGSTAKKVMEEIDNLVVKYTNDVQRMVAAGQQNTAECKKAEATLRALSQVQRDNIADTKRLGEVVADLTNTKLRDLRRALGSGKSALAALTGSDADIRKGDQIRKQMEAVARQIKLLEGEYVQISKGINNVSNQSDKWLDKAIKQQTELVRSLNKTDSSYSNQLAILKRLEAEEDRRKGKMSITTAMATANWNQASVSDLRRAKATITEARDKTSLTNTADIDKYNKALEQIEERLGKVSGKADKAKLSTKQLNEIIKDPKHHSIEQVEAALEQMQTQLKKMPAGAKMTDDFRRKMEQLQRAVKGTAMSEQELNNVIKRSREGKASLNELKQAYKALEEQLAQLSRSDKNFKVKQSELQQLKKEIDNVTGAAKNQSSALKTTLNNLVAYTGVFGAFNMAKQKLTELLNLNLKMSDSLANIRKVSGLAIEDINKLTTNLAKIDTRTSIEELNNIAYAGAKLGMGQYGITGMTQFVEAANKVNVALKEDLGQDSLTALSKFTEVMGLIPKMGVDKSMEAVGSAMFKLASTSTSTAGAQIEFAKRLTGIARTAGITADQILALGSASDSMMLMPEVASTAFNKLITSMQRAPGAIEESLSIPKGTISDLFEAGKSMDAIVLILQKMKEKGNMNALDDVFKDLGSDGARLIQVMVTMSKNVNMLEKHLYTSKKAFEEADAVATEYAIQQETAQALMERANNMWEKLFVNPEGVDNVKDMAQAWYDISAAFTDANGIGKALQTTVQGLILLIRNIITMIPGLIVGLGAGGMTGVIAGLITRSTSFLRVLVSIKIAAIDAYKAFMALNLVQRFSGIGAVVGALTSLVYFLNKTNEQLNEYKKNMEALKAARDRALTSAEVETSKLREYVHLLSDANTTQEQRRDLIQKFNSEYSTYLEKLGIEVKSVQDLKDAYSQLNREIKMKSIAQIRDETIAETVKPLQEKRIKSGQRVSEALQKAGFGAIDRGWVNQNADTHNGEWIYRRAMEAKLGSGRWDERSGKFLTDNGKGQTVAVAYDELREALIDYARDTQQVNQAIADVNSVFADLLKGWNDEEFVTYGKLKDKNKDKDKGKSKKASQVAKNRANALLANINSLYKEQMLKFEQYVAQANADGVENISKEEEDQILSDFQKKLETARGIARQAIATAGEEWDDFKKKLADDIFQTANDTDKQLLEAIDKSDIKELHKLFAKLSADMSKENHKSLSENLGALLDEIFQKGTTDLLEAAKKVVERQRELRKLLMEENFKAQVGDDTRGNFDRWDLLRPADGVDTDTVEGLQKMTDSFNKLISKSRKDIVKLFDIATEQEGEQFKDKMVEFVSEFGDVFDFASLSAENLRVMLKFLIEDEGKYQEAIKKTDDLQKKRNDQRWNKTKIAMDYTNAIDAQENEIAMQRIFGATWSKEKSNEGKPVAQIKRDRDKPGELISSWNNASEDMGFSFKVDNDPELLLYELRMEKAREYFLLKQKWFAQGQASEEEYNEAMRKYMESATQYSDRVLQDVSAQTDALMKFMEPLVSFGEAVGDAFATMTDDAAAGRKAIQQAMKQMIKSFATQAIQMIAQNEQEQANMAMHYTQLQLLRSTFDTAMLASQTQQGAAMLALRQTQGQAEVNQVAIEEQQKVALRSAGIFGWCVSTLGPIGGPIAYSAMMAILMGLLNFALGMIGKGDSSVESGTKTNTKLVSGMLTYDEGNVQTVLGDDGRMYRVKREDAIPDGVTLVKTPTTIPVNGEQSIVAEDGPELVIGRETTRAIMMRPDLMKQLTSLDQSYSGRGLQRYDNGNVSEIATVPDASASGSEAVVLSAVLTMLQKLDARLNEPIETFINMYGTNGLRKKLKEADSFMKGKD